MNWYLPAFISVITVSIVSVMQKLIITGEKKNPLTYSIVFQFVLGGLFFLYAFLNGFKMPPITQYPFHFLLSSAFWGFYTVLAFSALKYIDASTLAIISSTGPLFVVGASYLFLGEKINSWQLVGIFLIISSIVVLKKGTVKQKQLKGMLLALLMTILGAIAVTNDVFLLKHSELNSYLAIMSIMPGIVLLLLFPKTIQKVNIFLKWHHFKSLLIYSFLYAIQALTYYLAMNWGALVSQMNAISKSYIVLTIIIETVYFKQYQSIKIKVLASSLLLMGIYLLR